MSGEKIISINLKKVDPSCVYEERGSCFLRGGPIVCNVDDPRCAKNKAKKDRVGIIKRG